jgi:hypothetical protein
LWRHWCRRGVLVWSWQKWAARPCGRLAREVRYRLNKVIIKNCYLIPLVSKILNRLLKARVFTKLDLRNAYYRL